MPGLAGWRRTQVRLWMLEEIFLMRLLSQLGRQRKAMKNPARGKRPSGVMKPIRCERKDHSGLDASPSLSGVPIMAPATIPALARIFCSMLSATAGLLRRKVLAFSRP